MSNKLHHELKKEFQLERFVLFSDAVFAIAITLLVIEIKIPEIHENISDKLLLQSLKQLLPKFSGFLISFFLIGLYWRIHHRMFGFVLNYSPVLIRLNLFFLFFIVLMPFSTGFYGAYAGAMVEHNLMVPMTVYVINVACVGLVNFIMWHYITHHKHDLTEGVLSKSEIREAKLRSIFVPVIFLSMLAVAHFMSVLIAIYVPLFIPLVLRLLKKFAGKNEDALNMNV